MAPNCARKEYLCLIHTNYNTFFSYQKIYWPCLLYREGKLVLSLNIIAPKQGGGREEEQERRKKEEKFGKSQEGTCTAGGGNYGSHPLIGVLRSLLYVQLLEGFGGQMHLL